MKIGAIALFMLSTTAKKVIVDGKKVAKEEKLPEPVVSPSADKVKKDRADGFFDEDDLEGDEGDFEELCYCGPMRMKLRFDLVDMNTEKPPENMVMEGLGIYEKASFEVAVDEDVEDRTAKTIDEVQIVEEFDPIDLTEDVQEDGDFEMHRFVNTDNKPFDQGDVLQFVSIMEKDKESIFPASLNIDAFGFNKDGKEVEYNYFMMYTNSCDSGPILKVGQRLGMFIIDELEQPPQELCPDPEIDEKMQL